MSDRYVSAELLTQAHNAAIDLAKQLGAAEERLSVRGRPGPPIEPLKLGKIIRCDENLRPLNIESKGDLEQSEMWRMQQVAISTIALCNTRRSFKNVRLPDDNQYRTPALADVENTVLREIALLEKLNIAEVALEELSCLGNGDHPGSSVGNGIAQEALNNIRRIE